MADITRQIVASSDDCHTRDTTISLTGRYLMLCNGLYAMRNYIRFLNINIPQGAIIEHAHVEVCSDSESGVSSARMIVRGIKEPNTPTFSIDVDTRPITSAYVNWNLGSSPGDFDPDWHTNTWHGWPDGPELMDIIQEIINQPDWVSGNALAIKIENPDKDQSRSIWSWDGQPTLAPILVITYTAPQYTLTVTAGIGGTTSPAPGSYLYDAGIITSITAIPDAGYQFMEWREDGLFLSSDNPVNIDMGSNRNVTAIFEEIPTAQYTLIVDTPVGGTTVPAPGSYLYEEGAVVTLTAIPDAEYRFVEWQLSGGQFLSADNPIDLVMSQDWQLLAVFEEIPIVEYTLTLSTTIGGTTNPAPGSYLYPEGTWVSVTAIPNAGYEFYRWERSDGQPMSNDNPVSIRMDQNRHWIAVFQEIAVQGALSITSTPSGAAINLNGTYVGLTPYLDITVNPGTYMVLLTLSGYEDYSTVIEIFAGQTAHIDAILIPLPVKYTLTISAMVGGTTSPAPGSYLIDEGTVAQIVALPDSGYEFVEWQEGGTLISTANPLNIYMNADHNILAIFREISIPQHTLFISVSGQGTTNPAPGSYTYDEGVTVPVTAIPDSGYQFIEWQEYGIPIGISKTINLFMDIDHNIVAVFAEAPSAPEMNWLLPAAIVGGLMTAIIIKGRKK